MEALPLWERHREEMLPSLWVKINSKVEACSGDLRQLSAGSGLYRLRRLRGLSSLDRLLLGGDALLGLLDARLHRAATVLGLAPQVLPMRLLRLLGMIDTACQANV